ncbi:SPFH domain-containing protein [Romboutsia maritimum]|uniref:SPFH domain-containing protein n=1 Tax=Romboutsia maritimum TaxID=2020948 RepID=A0A371IRL9_9FIRM|nr:SPFH domain-containing protein [Romboutsia maritimum]RDY23127.1 SPFH domain-containing protein [Romboutsia maritimum]
MLKEENKYVEKEIKALSGIVALIGVLLFLAFSIWLIISGIMKISQYTSGGGISLILGILFIILDIILASGLRILNPNEALVLVLFGKYYGTLKKEGYYWINPFCSAVNPTYSSPITTPKTLTTDSNDVAISTTSKKISLKTMTLNNEKQKVNDQLGNPIIIGVVAIWRVVDPTKAVFNVENYKTFLSIQCDTTIRNIARLYPYDVSEDGDEKSLRGSSQEIADKLKEELQTRVNVSGIEVTEVRITHLSYAPEIAAAMLQRQQAEAIIAARKKIVEGAVGMVEMALTNLNQTNLVDLDEERKAAMVSNLLVVLCANKDTQPVVNSGSNY